MGPVARFTRDSASKYVWVSCLLAASLALAFTLSQGGKAVEDERLASQRRAVETVERNLEPELDVSLLAGPIAEPEVTGVRDAGRSILADTRIARVRIWAEQGDLLFSTDHTDNLGANAAVNNQHLLREALGGTITRWGLTDIGGEDEPGRRLVRTYIPIEQNAVVEVDQTNEGTIGPVGTEWRNYRVLAAALVALFLTLTILSLRDPLERINAGVRFAPSAIPAGYSLIDDERLHAVEEVYRLAHDRVARLEEKLASSEAARQRLEGDVQRALTSAATGTRTLTPPTPVGSTPANEPAPPASTPADVAPPSPPSPSERRLVAPAASIAPEPSSNGDATPAPDRPGETPDVPIGPDIVTVPDSEVVPEVRSKAPAKVPAKAPGGPLARAVREEEVPAELRPKRAPDKPRRAPTGGTPTEPAAPASVAIPAASEPEKSKRASRSRRKQEPVAAPVTVPTIGSEIDDAQAHQAALETFIRLTESDRQHEMPGVDQVDQGAVRAALARTAARKKPGGEKLKAHDGPPRESYGGPPKG